MSAAETKYQAILAVIADGRTVAEVAPQRNVDRRTMHRWLARYEREGLEGLTERSHPAGELPAPDAGGGRCDGARVATGPQVLGARRLALELERKGVDPATHQSLGDATPASRFRPAARTLLPERNGEQWVFRPVSRVGVVCVGWQQVSVGKNYGGSACDVLVADNLLQLWAGNELIKTVARTTTGETPKEARSWNGESDQRCLEVRHITRWLTPAPSALCWFGTRIRTTRFRE